MNNGTIKDNLVFGTKLIKEFDNWIFVTSEYGDGSGATASILTIEDESNIQDNWDDYLDMVADYYFEHYKDWTPVV